MLHQVGEIPGVEGVSFTYFTSKDVVRHPLVQRIVEAYEARQPGTAENDLLPGNQR